MSLSLRGMQGLGDNIYQRAILTQIRTRVYLSTAWPQIYADLGHITAVPSGTNLRTQAKNERRGGYAGSSIHRQWKPWHYRQGPESILESLAAGLGLTVPRFEMSAPAYEGPEIGRPYIVVRPVCLRKEWKSDSRNPLPGYVAEAVEALREDFTIVSVADLQDGQEWALDPLPKADIVYHRGELSVERLLGLVRGAAGLVGGVGWIVPAALAYRIPLFLIYGGWGYSNGPHRLFGPGVDRSFVEEAMPDVFCNCNSNSHACDKRISAPMGDRARAFALRLVRETALAAGSGDRVLSGPGASV
jgi:hypothetical protein